MYKRNFTEGAEQVDAELADLERLLDESSEVLRLTHLEHRKLSVKILWKIQEKKLYKPKYSSFIAYTQARWGYQKSYVYDLIKFAKETEKLSANADTPAPQAEGEARARRKQKKEEEAPPPSQNKNDQKKRPEFTFGEYGPNPLRSTSGTVGVRCT